MLTILAERDDCRNSQSILSAARITGKSILGNAIYPWWEKANYPCLYPPTILTDGGVDAGLSGPAKESWMPLSPDIFRSCGRELHRIEWQHAMARQLGPLDPVGAREAVDERLVRRWASGKREVPDWVRMAAAGGS